MSVKITCDAIADLTPELYKEYGIQTMPFGITLGDKFYADSRKVENQEIYNYVEKYKVLPKTSAVNEFTYESFWKEHPNIDGIIHICLSSKITSAYNNANIAAAKFEKIYVVDSTSLSSGTGMLVVYAAKLAKEGKTFEEIIEAVEEKKHTIQASFIVDKLDYLRKGGRCSSLALFGANLLKLHPMLLLQNGEIKVHGKFRGQMPDCTEKYMKSIMTEFDNADDTCFVTHTDATPEMLKAAEKSIKEVGKFKHIIYTVAGSTILSHCGKNTIGILYFSKSTNK